MMQRRGVLSDDGRKAIEAFAAWALSNLQHEPRPLDAAEQTQGTDALKAIATLSDDDLECLSALATTLGELHAIEQIRHVFRAAQA